MSNDLTKIEPILFYKYEEVKKVETKNSLGSVLVRSFDNGF